MHSGMTSCPSGCRGGPRPRCTQFGQEVIETFYGKKIHSTWVVPGGVDGPLTAAGRDRIQAWLPEAKETIEKTLTFWKREMDRAPWRLAAADALVAVAAGEGGQLYGRARPARPERRRTTRGMASEIDEKWLGDGRTSCAWRTARFGRSRMRAAGRRRHVRRREASP